MNYEEEMHIDENALDVEFLEQPALMVKYSTKLAEARLEKDLAKEELDIVKSDLDLDIRDNPENYDLKKVTEGAITSLILTDEKYIKAQKRFNEANYEVNVLFGVVSAIEARKSALENLVKLHGQQYFAGPSVPHDLTELREQRSAAQEKKLGKPFKRKNT